MANIIFTGDLNFPIIDWQMETSDGGAHENQVQIKFCNLLINNAYSNMYIDEPMRKYNILDVFLTNSNQLTRQ